MNIEELVRARVTIVRKSGDELEGCCPNPNHQDRSPSFRFNIKKNVFYCFGCHIKGGIRQFVNITGGGDLEFDLETDILKAKLVNLDAPIPMQKMYSTRWLSQFDLDTPYWRRTRRLSPATIKKFRLGYDATANAATIPLFTEDRQVLGVIKRLLNAPGKQRYTQPAGFVKQRHLFGAWAIGDAQKVAAVEGPVDAISCWNAGIPAVACLGSNMSEWQAKALAGSGASEIVIWTDNDTSGAAASDQFVEALYWLPVFVSVAGYGRGMPSDPAACTPEQRRWAMEHARVVKGPT